MKIKKTCKEKLKKICITTFLAGIIFSGSVFAADLNVEFSESYRKWNQMSKEQKEQILMPRTYSRNVPDRILEDVSEKKVPSILNELMSNFKIKSSRNALKDIEASYTDTSYNLANRLNMRIEHQGTTTECWAFSMIKSLETNIALRNNTTELENFSERHMDYATSRTFTDGINKIGFEREVGKGGLPVMALAYLTNGQGAVLESDMPFEDNENKIALSSIDKAVDTVVTEYVTLPVLNKTYTKDEKGNTVDVTYYDNSGKIYTSQEVEAVRNIIKRNIIENGAVPSLTAANHKKYYNSTNIIEATNYNCNETNVNRDHGITIVGWDDNYSRDHFAEGAKPSTDGAYIVLNSYGEENFDKGYLYVSYEDFFIESEIYVVKNSEEKDYDNIYQSDFYGGIFSMGTTNQATGYYANIFERDSEKDEIIKNVGVTVSDYVELEIYINPENDSLEQDELIKIRESTGILEPGYHRIEVTPTQLVGEQFAIVVKQTSENGIFYFSVETPVANSAYACVDSENNSYYSLNGEIWNNLSSENISGLDMKKTDVCIKAFIENGLLVDDDDENNGNSNVEQPDYDDPNSDNPNTDDPNIDEPDNGNSKEDEDDATEAVTISSEKYLIVQESIYKIVDETTIQDFKNNITTEASIHIYDAEEEITENDQIIKTGMKLKLNDEKEYELIVRGDINCDGKVSLTDLSKLILHYNEKKGYILTGTPFSAADMNCDQKVSLTDVSQMIILYNKK